MIKRAATSQAFLSCLARTAVVAAGLWAGLHADTAYADVTGQQIIRGDVTFIHDGDRLIIQASDGSIINYLSFDILPWETIQFIQPHDMARVLNRITGPEPSVLEGTLLANGQVYLVNPAGVYFTGNAVVDVGGLYAAAGNLTNSRFVHGVNKFTDISGEVVNEGLIQGKYVHLMGHRVANHGSIISDRGIVTMLAGDTIILKQHGERISVNVDGRYLTGRTTPYGGMSNASMTATPGVENTGTISVNRGQVVLGAGDLYALAVRNSGTIESSKGDITIAATDGLIQNDGLISASTGSGHAGTVHIMGPSVLNSGVISADSNSGSAGSVWVLSQNHTFLRSGSVISAAGGSGNAKGGDVLIHSYGGLTVLADGSVVDVSGGAGGGRGGFAEVSGHALFFNGDVDLSAKSGYSAGSLLIDPYNIIVNHTGGDDSFLDDAIIEFGEGGMNDCFIKASTLSSIVGNITLQAMGTIYVDAPIDLTLHNNDLYFQANNTITIREPIIGAHNVYFTADYDGNGYGWVSLNVPLSFSGEAVFSGDHIRLNGGLIETASTQDYFGDVYLGMDNHLLGTRVSFADAVNTKWDVAQAGLEITGFAQFGGPVGNASNVSYLTVNGPSEIIGGVHITSGPQSYFGPVTLIDHTDLISTGAGRIRFYDTIDGPFRLHVGTAGVTRFDGLIGGLVPLKSLTTDELGLTRIGADMFAGQYLKFSDHVRLDADVHLTAGQQVEFKKTITGFDHDLIVDSPLTIFRGDATGLDLLQTDAAGLTIIDAERIWGRALDFNDDVEILTDVFFSGSEFVDFDRTLNGPYDVRIASDHLVRFGGDVGGVAPLTSLRVDVGDPDLIDENLIIIDGHLIRVVGDILLNQDGRSGPATVATIAGRGGDLTIESLNGDIYMGLNEKITALGDLNLFAENGSVTVGDMNALHDIDVRGEEIYLWRRPGSLIRDADGNLVLDLGIDIIAGGSISASTRPTLIGAGAPPIFATPEGRRLAALLLVFRAMRMNDLDLSDFTFNGTVLDLTVSRPLNTLGNAFTDSPGEINDKVELDPIAIRAMERLALYLRALGDEELLATVEGRELYMHPPHSGHPDQQHETVAHRLRRDSVLAVLDQHSGVFLREATDPTTGEPIMEDQSEHIRMTLAQAWADYAATTGAEASPANWRPYLIESETHEEALTYLDGLNLLLTEIRTMGVTPRELRASTDSVLSPITPDALSQDEFEQAIAAESMG